MISDDCHLTKGSKPRSAYSTGKKRADCLRCGGSLEPRRVRWCSDECAAEWNINHVWGEARKAAIKRDGKCVRCGATGHVPPEELRKARESVREWFASNPEPPRQDYETWRKWRKQSNAQFRASDRVAIRFQLEVNHIVPALRKSRGTPNACVNHLDNLETLCHSCHLIETNRQRADRRKAA